MVSCDIMIRKTRVGRPGKRKGRGTTDGYMCGMARYGNTRPRKHPRSSRKMPKRRKTHWGESGERRGGGQDKAQKRSHQSLDTFLIHVGREGG